MQGHVSFGFLPRLEVRMSNQRWDLEERTFAFAFDNSLRRCLARSVILKI